MACFPFYSFTGGNDGASPYSGVIFAYIYVAAEPIIPANLGEEPLPSPVIFFWWWPVGS